MPDNASQTKFKKGNCKLYCILFITNLFLSSLLGLLIAQFFIIHTSIEDLPTFLKNGNTLFINTNSFIERNEPLFQDVLKGVLLNSVQFNKTMLEINNAIDETKPKILNLINFTENQLLKINNAIDITQPKVLNLINFTENQLLKIDNLLNDNLNQLVNIDKSLKDMSNNNIATPSSSSVSSVDHTSTPTFDPTIPNSSP